jgi:YnbE-like lipoprotein
MMLSNCMARGVSFPPPALSRMMGERRLIRIIRAGLLASAMLNAAGCTPTVRVEAPREPITINLNIKLDADVRLRVEEKAKEDVKSKSIF